MAKVQLFRDLESGFIYTEKPANVPVEEFNPPADHPHWGPILKGDAPAAKPQPTQPAQEGTDVL